MSRHIAVIGCGVFQHELEHLAAKLDENIELNILDAGLHARPNELRTRAQAAIDEVDADTDGVVLAYGLCGRGVAGLVARTAPIFIPRVHDCIGIFLGSNKRYLEQFRRQPGTRYMTTGWFDKKTFPNQLHLPSEYTDYSVDERIRNHPHFSDLARVHGEENAAHIVTFFESWKKNYRRIAFIDTGVAEAEPYERFCTDVAGELGWDYERLEGSLDLMKALLRLDETHPEILVVRPGQKIALTGDAGILAAVDVDSTHASATLDFDESDIAADNAEARRHRERYERTLGLGVDAGGTYTDCVLYEIGPRNVVASAKSRTTHGRLLDGIADSVRRLPADRLKEVGLVAVSTTLATNAIVESTGLPVGLVLMNPPSVAGDGRDYGCPVRTVGGQVDIAGEQIEPVDDDEVTGAIEEMIARDGIGAVAVSGYGGVVNNVNEQAIRRIVTERFGLPVVCGHELTGRLDFHRRAATAVLNARLLPLIGELIDALEGFLASVGVEAPLTIVRGDGSLVSIDEARRHPVHTILSGPAASVAGALELVGGVETAVVVDVGGTTTDVAGVTDGHVELSPEGAEVGAWRTSVEALDILTTGAGGDSHVDVDREGRITMGPHRVEPLCRMAAEWPETIEVLTRLPHHPMFDYGAPGSLDVFAIDRRWTDNTGCLLDDAPALDATSARVLRLLSARPHSRLELCEALGVGHPSLLKTKTLEDRRLVVRGGLTPTDILHVAGEYTEFDVKASRLAVDAFAALSSRTPEAVCREVRGVVVRRVATEAIRKLAGPAAQSHDFAECDFCRMALDKVFEGAGPEGLEVTLASTRPVIGIGAPAEAWLPEVGRVLRCDCHVPEHAGVANAVGAVTSRVVVHGAMTIRPGSVTPYVLYGSGRPKEFDEMDDALAVARKELAAMLHTEARRRGTAERTIHLHVDRRVGRVAGGETVLLEVVVSGRLEGCPVLGEAGD